eukprot:39337_1
MISHHQALISNIYWEFWLYDREDLTEDEDNEYIRNLDIKLPFDTSKIEIKNGLKKANLDDSWILKLKTSDNYKLSDYDYKLISYRKRIKGYCHIFFELYDA